MFYKEARLAKSGQKIPVFNSGRTAHSSYNPEREAEHFLSGADGVLFAVIFGAGAGFHIKAFLNKNPECRLLVVEKSAEDLDFLKRQFPLIQEFFLDRRIIFCAADQMEDELLKNYIPALYGNLEIAALRPWADEDKSFYDGLLRRLKSALAKISSDYSTQAAFGAVWQKNIFCNLKILKKMQSEKSAPPLSVDAEKTAAIIAAGPSLDRAIEKIKKEREKYFVIASDTAYKILSRSEIKIDAAVSIDAQYLSAEHFNAHFCKETIFILDLAGNHSVARFAHEKGARIVFSNLGHPLASFASNFCRRPFLRLYSGGGTVALAALSAAKKMGFKKIEIFGADFGYFGGKPYARGSYLDELYRADEKKIKNAESAFLRLMFRSELKKNSRGVLQSRLMQAYQSSLEEFIGEQNFLREDFVCAARFEENSGGQLFFQNEFNFFEFKSAVKKCAEEAKKNAALPEAAIAFPYMAYLQRPGAQNKISANEAKNLALNKILLYNEMI